jgi:hypothetical protein
MRRASHTICQKLNASPERQNNLALIINFHKSVYVLVAFDGNEGAAFDGQESDRTYRLLEYGEKGFPDSILHSTETIKLYQKV